MPPHACPVLMLRISGFGRMTEIAGCRPAFTTDR
jgi:hypothetical protein